LDDAFLEASIAASSLSARSKAFVRNTLLDFSFDTRLVSFVAQDNAVSDLFQTVLDRDVEWRAATSVTPYQTQILEGPAAVALNEVAFQAGQSAIGEAFTMGLHGGLVGSTAMTSDYYQADEAKFTGAFQTCAGGLNVDEAELDASTGLVLQHVSLPLIDGDNRVVGVVAWGTFCFFSLSILLFSLSILFALSLHFFSLSLFALSLSLSLFLSLSLASLSCRSLSLDISLTIVLIVSLYLYPRSDRCWHPLYSASVSPQPGSCHRVQHIIPAVEGICP
jgi:hypothetical protein